MPDEERLCFEDFRPGEVFDLGEYTFTEEAIVEFASRYDPQPFHVDRQAAAQSGFGGLVASGWHTGAVFMRLLVDSLLLRTNGLGSPGADELRFLHPVRPGDRVRGRFEVVRCEPSARRPERGTVHALGELTNGDGHVVFRMRSRAFVSRRAV